MASEAPYPEGTVYIVRRFCRPWSLLDEPGWNLVYCTLDPERAERELVRTRQRYFGDAADIIAMQPDMSAADSLWRREGYDDDDAERGEGTSTKRRKIAIGNGMDDKPDGGY